jgi:hypothetical protein
MNNNFVAKELYPYIMLYQGLFEDIDKNIAIIRESEAKDTNFCKWSSWMNFGRYVGQTPNLINIHEKGYDVVQEKNNLEGLESDQYDMLLEIAKNVYMVDKDYIERYGLDVDFGAFSQDKKHKLWKCGGPQLCSYDIANESTGTAGYEAYSNGLAMTYHSDYTREPIKSPGYKFVFSTLVYHNDDYEGGEISFYVNNKQMTYAPKKGDILVFPAGHPDYLTEDGKVFIHAAKAVSKNNKYISRSHWLKYEEPSEEWKMKEKEFGDSWTSVYEDLCSEYRKNNPNKVKIDKEGVQKIELK